MHKIDSKNQHKIIVLIFLCLILSIATLSLLRILKLHQTAEAPIAVLDSQTTPESPTDSETTTESSTDPAANPESQNDSESPAVSSSNGAKPKDTSKSPPPSTTSTGGYDRSNPLVAAALAQVGRSGLICGDLVCHVIRSTKYLERKVYTNTFSNDHKPDSFNINAPHTFQLYYDYLGTSEIPGEACAAYVNYLVTNNSITSYSFSRSPENCRPDLPDPDTKKAEQNRGKTVYTSETVSPSSCSRLADYPAFATQVSFANRQPGDILFWSSKYAEDFASHTAVYIGNDQAVHGGWDGKNVVIAGIILPNQTKPTPTVWRLNPNYEIW